MQRRRVKGDNRLTGSGLNGILSCPLGTVALQLFSTPIALPFLPKVQHHNKQQTETRRGNSREARFSSASRDHSSSRDIGNLPQSLSETIIIS
jgi:hypothetical protein